MNLSRNLRFILGFIITSMLIAPTAAVAAQSIGSDRAMVGEMICQPDGLTARISLTNDYPGTAADIDFSVEGQTASADAIIYQQSVTLEVFIPNRMSLPQTDTQATLFLYADEGDLDVRTVDVRFDAVDCTPPPVTTIAPESTTSTVVTSTVPETVVPVTVESTTATILVTTTTILVTTTTSIPASTTTAIVVPVSVPTSVAGGVVVERASASENVLAATGMKVVAVTVAGLGLLAAGFGFMILRRPERT